MPVPTARVWRRYGHLQIYVSAGDLELGWYDPQSGRFQIDQPAMVDDFWSAVCAECRRLLQEGQLADAVLPAGTITEPGQPVAPQPAGPQERTPGPQPSWDDLARNKPGESASATAKELRGQHPFLVTTA